MFVSPRFIVNLPCKVASEIMKYNFANIHFTLEKLGYEAKAGPLLMQGKIILVVIKKYLFIKRCHVWQEIAKIVEAEGIAMTEVGIAMPISQSYIYNNSLIQHSLSTHQR